MTGPAIMKYPIETRRRGGCCFLPLFKRFPACGSLPGRGAINIQEAIDATPERVWSDDSRWDGHWIVIGPAKGPPPVPNMAATVRCEHGAIIGCLPEFRVDTEICDYCEDDKWSAEDVRLILDRKRVFDEWLRWPEEALAADKGTAPFTVNGPDPLIDLLRHISDEWVNPENPHAEIE